MIKSRLTNPKRDSGKYIRGNKHKFNMCLEQRFLGKSREPESLVL